MTCETPLIPGDGNSLMSPPRVLMRRADGTPPSADYIGPLSKWANPFEAGVDGDAMTVLSKYEAHIRRVAGAQIAELRGLDLVCGCGVEPCHSPVLLKLANRGR